MKLLLVLITLITATTYCWAEENHEVPALSEDEVIWETEQIGGLNEVEISPLGEVFYNTKDSIVQVRSVETGDLIDEILFPNTARLDAISISADGRYMAVSGQPEYIFIYDLVLEREVKRLTAIVWEEEEFGENVKYEAEKWLCSSISPDGTKVTGVAITDAGVKKSSLIVIDIQSELILYESRRILYDRSIQKPDNFEWISSKFSLDGKYIISQLDYDFYHGDESDSIYIHDANNFELYDVVLNDYNSTDSEVVFSKFESVFCVPNGSSIILYYLNEKKSNTIFFQKSTRNIVFSALDRNLLVRNGLELPNVYNYESEKLKQQINYVGIAQTTTKDNKVIYKPAHYFGLALIKIDWNKTTNISTNKITETTITPNPTNGVVNFSLNCTEPDLVYSIYSSVGAVLASDIKVKQGRDVSIDFSAYPTGIYYVSFLCNSELKTYKIIKEG